MCSKTKEDNIVTVGGVIYKKQVILADANLPYKFTMDRNRNNLLFCINADEFSDQSFHSVILNLDKGSVAIVPGIRNGFASAVDQTTGNVYLGGSDGVFSYNYYTNNIDKPALIAGIDVFDMFYQKHLYIVDTATQSLKVFKYGKQMIVPNLEGHLIHHFVVDIDGNVYFVDPTGLYVMKNGTDRAILLDDRVLQYRGATLDINGVPHFIAQDGIYKVNGVTEEPERILAIDKGFGLAFDKNNNIVYGDERAVITLNRC